MKIESITLDHISMPRVAPFDNSFGRETDRECVTTSVDEALRGLKLIDESGEERSNDQYGPTEKGF